MTLLQLSDFNLAINDKTICRNFNWQLEPGDFCGILGVNGSGKTTLLHSLANLNTHTDGIFIKGKAITAWRRKTLAKVIGILFQNTQDDFGQSVYEFCLTGRFPHLASFTKETKTDLNIVNAALEIMGLADLKHRRLSSLSGGEKRRTAIATLLAQDPEIYLLDEPTNHLDIAYQIKVLSHFKTLTTTQNKAVILSMHDINLAAHFCNKILLLLDNTLMIGQPQEILTQDNLRKLYGLEFQNLGQAERTYWQPY